MKPSDSPGSVSRVLQRFKQGDVDAANDLMLRYFDRVVAAATSRMRAKGLRVTDGDDVAISVFQSLWDRAADQRFDEDDLEDREQLWRLLCRLMHSKTTDAVRRERALKRGGGKLRGESVFVRPDDERAGLDNEAGRSPAPDDLVLLAERHATLMEALQTDSVREVVALRLEGFEVSEIAQRVGLSTRSVKRKLAIARSVWSDLVEAE